MASSDPAEPHPSAEGEGRWSRLRAGWAPWAVLAASVPFAPVAGWLGVVATRRRYADSPPPCFGLGWGCDLPPEDYGVLAAIAYIAVLVVLALLVGLLHLGGRRAATARSVVALVGVALLWVMVLVGTATA